MPTENVTTKFKVDISDLKKGIADANKQIKLATAEFKNATVGLEDWSKSADGLTAKIQQQNKIVDAEKKKLDLLKQQLDRLNKSQQNGEKVIADLTKKYNEAVKTYGETSDEAKSYAKQLKDAQAAQERNTKAADDLNLKMINQDTAVKNAQAQVTKYETALTDLQQAAKDAAEAEAAAAEEAERLAREAEEAANKEETLTEKVKRQETELQDLRQKYIDVAAAKGKDSQEAQELGAEIDALSTDLKENKTALNEAEQAADDFDKSLDDTANGGLQVFAVALGNVIADLVTNAINKLAELGKQTIEVGKAFDTSMSQVGAVSGATGEELLQLRDKAKEMGGSTKFTAVETADAFNYMAMAGWKTEDMLEGIEGVLNLAAASNSDLATTSDIVTNALTAMGYTAGDAGRLADVMAAAASNANTDVEMMGQTFKYAAPVVGALGYSMEDTAVAIGLMGNAGIQADQAGTSLRSILTRLSAPTGECETAMNELGISLTDSEGRMKTLDKVMRDLRIAFDGLSETQQTAYAKHIAGQQAISGLLAIVNAAPEDFTKLTNAVANSEGAAEEMASTMLDNLGGDITLMQSNLESLQLMLYEKLEPALRKCVEALDDFIDDMKWIIENGTPIASVITGVATAVGVFLAIVKKQAIIAALVGLLAKVKAGFLGIGAAMAANPIGLVIALIAGLVAAFVVLWNKSEAFRNFWINLWETIKTAAGFAWEDIKAFFSGAWEKLQEIWGNVSAWFAEKWEALKSIFSTIAEWINANVFQPIIEFFRPIITFFSETWAIIKELAAGAWEAIKLIWGIVSSWFNENIVQPVKTFFSKLWDGIKSAASTAWNGIKGIWQAVSGWFNNTIIQPVANFFSGMWDGLKKKASDAWNGIKSVFSPVVDWFKEKFSAAWKKVKDVFSTGGKVFDGIKDGIVSAFKTVVNAIIRGINKVIAIPFNAINGILDKIQSVSIAGVEPFKNLVSRLTVPEIPELAQGGIVNRRTLATIGEDGAEAVIPLQKNKRGLKEIAQLLAGEMQNSGTFAGTAPQGDTINNYNFNQTNNSPKALSRWDIYRQTRNMMNALKTQGV